MNNRPIFVFDTNVLVSAHLIDGSVPARALLKAFTLGIVVRSGLTLIEFADKFLTPKFEKYLSLEERLIQVENFKQNSLLVSVIGVVHECRDPNDDMILDLAVASNASCIVSGDRDLLILNPFRSIPVLSPTEFLSQY